jgi:CRP/FNR family cyclic AMP-dependent transcriptional regulator
VVGEGHIPYGGTAGASRPSLQWATHRGRRISITGTARRSDKIDVLSQVPLFAGLTKRELTQLARFVTEVEIPPRDYLAVEGEIGREAMVLLSGTATVRRGGRKVAQIGRGDVVGEMSLITHLPRNATVRADTFVGALVMSAAEFDRIMEEHPQVAVKVLRTVATRLAEATRQP